MTLRSIEWQTTCPHCGMVQECVAQLTPAQPGPQDGDLSFCLTCGCFGVMDRTAPGGVKKPGPEQADQLTNDPMVAQTLAAWRQGLKDSGGSSDEH